jgi:checkpoint serine/threonine-protein kinase
MLVDFGRAIDLNSANNDGTSLLDTVFSGPATTDEMMCVSMRQDLPWSFDLDTFGVCASAHVLLFGSHLEIERNKSKRWMPKQKFPRYFEKKLWTEILDTLLNLDEDFGRAIGSRPYSLKRLRNRIEEYLRQEEARLRAALKHQASILPSKRS